MQRIKLSASRYCCYGLLLLIILFFALIRFQLRESPLERDEGEYAYAGQLILQGIPPYQLVYSMKLPGTFAAYSVILAVFGQTPGAIHALLDFDPTRRRPFDREIDRAVRSISPCKQRLSGRKEPDHRTGRHDTQRVQGLQIGRASCRERM